MYSISNKIHQNSLQLLSEAHKPAVEINTVGSFP
jgi:hypothetical protein